MPEADKFPQYLKVPKETMERIGSGTPRRKSGPKPQRYRITPRPTVKHESTSEATATPGSSFTKSSGVSDPFDFIQQTRRLVEEPPPTPVRYIHTPSHLSRPDLFQPPLPPMSQSIIWTDNSIREARFLHNAVEQEENTYTSPWLPL
jgi:hypothetical protein